MKRNRTLSVCERWRLVLPNLTVFKMSYSYSNSYLNDKCFNEYKECTVHICMSFCPIFSSQFSFKNCSVGSRSGSGKFIQIQTEPDPGPQQRFQVQLLSLNYQAGIDINIYTFLQWNCWQSRYTLLENKLKIGGKPWETTRISSWYYAKIGKSWTNSQ